MADDYDKMSLAQLREAAQKKGIKVATPAAAPADNYDNMSIEELRAEAAKKQSASAKPEGFDLQGAISNVQDVGGKALKGAGELGASFVQGINEGAENLVNAGNTISRLNPVNAIGQDVSANLTNQALRATMGQGAVQLPAPAAGVDFSSNSQAAMQPQLQAAQQDFKPLKLGPVQLPGAATVAQEAGKQVAQLPVWEVGAGAAGMLGQGAMRLAGPAGQALMKGAAELPGAQQFILRLTGASGKGALGGFTAGVQQALGEQTKGQGGQAPSKPDMGKVFQAGIDMAEAGAEFGPLLHAAGEGALKIVQGVKALRLKNELGAKLKQVEARRTEADNARKSVHAELLKQQEAEWDQKREEHKFYSRESMDDRKVLTAGLRDELKRAQKAKGEAEAKAARDKAHLEDRLREIDESRDDLRMQLVELMRDQLKEEQEFEAEAERVSAENKMTGENKRHDSKANRAEQLRQLKSYHAKQINAIEGQLEYLEQLGAKLQSPVKEPFSLKPKTLKTPTEEKASIKAEEQAKKWLKPKAKPAAPKEPQLQEDLQKFLHGGVEENVQAEEPPKPAEEPQAPTEEPPANQDETDPFVHRKIFEAALKEGGWVRDRPRGVKAGEKQTTTGYVLGGKKSGNPVIPQAQFFEEHPDLKYLHDAAERERSDWKDAERMMKEAEQKDPHLLYENASGLAGFKQATDLLKKQGWLTYENFKALMGVQNLSDILGQWDEPLSQALDKAGAYAEKALGSPAKNFKKAAGKVNFAMMGAGEIDPGPLNKAIRLRGNAEQTIRYGEGFKDLPEAQKDALIKANAAVREYLDKVEPVKKWLDENTKNIPDHVGLGRLRNALDQQLRDLTGVHDKQGFGEKAMSFALKLIMLGKFRGGIKAPLYHLVDKSIAVGAKEGGVNLGRAIKDNATNPTIQKFNDKMWSHIHGAITQSYGESSFDRLNEALSRPVRAAEKLKGGKLAVKTVTGRVFEQGANEVASTAALNKFAPKYGYKSGVELAQDIMDAREGKGPLGLNSDKLDNIMSDLTDFVGDVTGTQVPGFRNTNSIQRNKALKPFALYTTAKGVAYRNFHNLLQGVFRSKTAGELAKNTGKVMGYNAGIFLVAGAEGVVWQEFQPAVKAIIGDPTYYRYQDMAHAARKLWILQHVPSAHHLQAGASTWLTNSGTSTIGEVLKTGKKLVSGDEKVRFDGITQSLMLAGAAEIAGTMGIGVMADYAKGVDEAMKGYKTQYVYEKLGPGIENHVADITTSTNAGTAIMNHVFGFEGEKEEDQAYFATKSKDLREWCKRNDPEVYKETADDEKTYDSEIDRRADKQALNEDIQSYKDAGLDDNSPQIKAVKDEYARNLASGDKELERYRRRSEIWEEAAARIQQSKKSHQAPITSPTPQVPISKLKA